MAASDRLTTLLEPLVVDLGYEFVGLEYRPGGQGLLRVYIDDPENGVGLDDCERVSREVSALMDVEDVIHSEYTLEVSSPGMERPLFRMADYVRFAGEQVKVTSLAPVDGRRKFRGKLSATKDDAIVVEVDGQEYEIDLANVGKARLDPQW